MSSEDSLTAKQVIKGNRSLLGLSGRIDENAQFPVPQLAGIDVLIFDFRGVKSINSMGIQAWIAFIKTLPTDLRLAFQHCPLRIVNQMNLFPAFMGGRNIKVLSFYAPYYCRKCDRAETIHIETQSLPMGETGPSIPPADCPSCKQAMEFGAIEEKYLLFLTRRSA